MIQASTCDSYLEQTPIFQVNILCCSHIKLSIFRSFLESLFGSDGLAPTRAILKNVLYQLTSAGPTHFPQNLVGEVLSPTSFRLRWNPPPEEYHNGEIREYRVNVTDIQTGSVQTFSTTVTELVVEDLHPYFRYESVVTAVTVGEGPYSAAVGVRTHEAGKGSTKLQVIVEYTIL